MKPVNLNQLLSHEKSNSLSFFQSPICHYNQLDDVENFFVDIKRQLVIQKKKSLVSILDNNKNTIFKILHSHPDKSHGFFISEVFQGYVILDQMIDSYCMIGQTFHLRPMLEELFVNPEFILINVSLYDIKIYKGDFLHLEILYNYEFDQLPKNFHQFSSRLYAPQYLGLIPYKTILALKTIAQKVKDLLLYQSKPVIVTGLDEIRSIFLRYFNDTYGVISHLEEDFYEKTCVEIIARCRSFRPLVMDYYSAQLRERLKRMVKSRFLVTDLEDIITAVYEGRVVHLVLPTEKKLWGKIYSKTGKYIIHKKMIKSSIDILNELADEVMKQGGNIQILKPQFFPENSNVLAIIKRDL